MVKNKKSISRKDFETFKFGVERLKELEKELNSLNTIKFPVETAVIRSKLKNVAEIPDIERRMKDLKAKIRGNYSIKKKKSPYKKVDKEILSVKGNVGDMQSQILALNSKLNILKGRINSSAKENEISKLESQITFLKSKIAKVEKTSKNTPKLVKKIKKLSKELREQDNFDLGKDRDIADLSRILTMKEMKELGQKKRKR